MPGRSLGLALVATLLALTAAACGRDDGIEESQIVGDSLTVYSSLPLQGPLAPVARDVVRAEKLALREAGGRAGEFNVNYVSLDSADPESGATDAGRVAANARRAVQTPNTIAYLGELEPGASATSLPIINEAGVLQVSPRDTFAGLSERGGLGEPERYYPSGVVNFARAVPPGDRQVRLLMDALRAHDVRRLVVAHDGGPAGSDVAARIGRLAEREGIALVGRERLDGAGEVPAGFGDDVRGERPDALLYAGAASDVAVDALRDVHEAAPDVRIFGDDSLALSPGLARRLGTAAERLEVTAVDPLDPDDFERRFEAAYGKRPDDQAVLGYRAMQLVLDAVRRSGADAASRREVVRRAVTAAGPPRARFSRQRVAGGALVTVRPRM